jgi:hypothetical protein
MINSQDFNDNILASSDGLLSPKSEVITAFLITSGIMKKVEIDSDDFLSGAYQHLNCRNIDIIEIKLANGNYVDVVVDGEILLTSGSKLVTYCERYNQPIIGDFLVVCCDDEGGTISAPSDFEESMIVTNKDVFR